MNYHRQSPTRLNAYNESNTSLSPLTIRRRLENAVPAGVVASRIYHIQSRTNPTTPKPSPMVANRRREHSRTGFGRRVNSRFGHPASRNDNPNEVPQVETSHSYLGLNISRTNHGQEHAIAGHRTRYDRTPGLHGLIEPKGLLQRVQYDALSPWSTIPPTKFVPCSRPPYSPQTMDSLQEDTSSEINDTFRTRTPRQINNHTTNLDTHRQIYKTRLEENTKSDQTFLTTSTMRRQSVRDIFYHYGIERPVGLVSEEFCRNLDSTPRPPSQRVCHVCSWANYSLKMKCRRCAHVLCRECDMIPQPSSHQNKANVAKKLAMRGVDARKSDPPKKENSPVECPGTKFSGGPLIRDTQNGRQDRKISDQVEKFPSFAVPKSTSWKATTTDQPVILPLVSGTRTTTKVKNSPFLIADMLSNGIALHLHPVDVGPEDRARHDQLHSIEIKHHHHSSHLSDVECDSPTCRATHDGHEPYRHSSVCGEKKRRWPIGTDTGYVADTSRGEDQNDFHSDFQSNSELSWPNSRKPHASKESSDSAQRATTTRCGDNLSSVSESIECHGYPRTGHARHGSFPLGDIGECQHCLEDCQCTACQRTHHNVRCCVHEDHNSMLHKHHMHKLTASAPKPLECATSPRAEKPQKCLSKPPTIRTPSNRKLSTPLSLAKQSKSASPSTPAMVDPVKKRPSLMTSQKSSYIKEISNGMEATVQSPSCPRGTPVKKITPSRSGSCHSGSIVTTRRTTKEPILLRSSERKEPTKGGKFGVSMSQQSHTAKVAPNSTKPLTSSPTPPNPRDKSKPIVKATPLQNERLQVDATQDIPTPLMETQSASPKQQSSESSPVQRGERVERICAAEQSEQEHEHEQVQNRREICEVPLCESSLTVKKKLQCPSVDATPRQHITKDTASRKSYKNLSTMLQEKEKTTSALLNEGLLEGQLEPRRIRQDSKAKIESVSQRSEGRDQDPQVEESNSQVKRPRKISDISSQCVGEKGWWPLKLVDIVPSPACPNDGIKIVEEHRLSQDKTIEEEVVSKKVVEEHNLSQDETLEMEETVHKSLEEHELGQVGICEGRAASCEIVPGIWTELLGKEEVEQNCTRKQSSLNGSNQKEESAYGIDGSPVVGITVILHIEGREDLVIRSDLGNSGSVKGIGY